MSVSVCLTSVLLNIVSVPSKHGLTLTNRASVLCLILLTVFFLRLCLNPALHCTLQHFMLLYSAVYNNVYFTLHCTIQYPLDSSRQRLCLMKDSQYYGRSRQCGCPVGDQCSMGLDRNPLINGLIQHTFKLNFLFVKNSQ